MASSVDDPSPLGALIACCEAGLADRSGPSDQLDQHVIRSAEAAAAGLQAAAGVDAALGRRSAALIDRLWASGYVSAASALVDALLPHAAGDLAVRESAARLAFERGDILRAAELLQDWPAPLSDSVALLAAAVAHAPHEPERNLMRVYVEAAPVHAAPTHPRQRVTVAVVNPFPDLPPGNFGPDWLHFQANFPGQLSRALSDRVRFLSVIADAREAVAAAAGLPRPDCVLNNVTNAEQLATPGSVERLARVAESFGRPVLNHPARAVLATRQRNALALAGLPGVVAPQVGRFWNDPRRSADLVARIAELFGFPVIIRTVFEQMGQGTFRAESPEALAAVLASLVREPQIYAIAWRGAPHEGLHRVLRAAFVAGRPHLIRADYGLGWNVRARREAATQDLYRDKPELLERANRLVSQPESELPPDLTDRLVAIASRIPLDIFGMDFDVAPDGELVVFECNATMNLLSNVPGALAYPAEREAGFLEDVIRLFEQRAGS